jgi:hypothetical protein
VCPCMPPTAELCPSWPREIIFSGLPRSLSR